MIHYIIVEKHRTIKIKDAKVKKGMPGCGSNHRLVIVTTFFSFNNKENDQQPQEGGVKKQRKKLSVKVIKGRF